MFIFAASNEAEKMDMPPGGPARQKTQGERRAAFGIRSGVRPAGPSWGWMNPTIAQRWFNGRENFRPSQEPLNPDRYGVELVEYGAAKAFVERHHYSGSFSPSIQSYGLFRKPSALAPAALAGIATFAPASNPASIGRWTGLAYAEGAELARFVLLDACEGNSETWFLARALRAFKAARPATKVILSYSDPVSRTRADGSTLFPGHVGGIYSASNALYLGRASPKVQYLAPDGRAIANRILSKLRNGERGRRYAEAALADAAGLQRAPDEPAGAYVRRALAVLRPQKHPGNHLYAFPLAADRREKRQILKLPALILWSGSSGPYPKRPDGLAA